MRWHVLLNGAFMHFDEEIIDSVSTVIWVNIPVLIFVRCDALLTIFSTHQRYFPVGNFLKEFICVECRSVDRQKQCLPFLSCYSCFPVIMTPDWVRDWAGFFCSFSFVNPVLSKLLRSFCFCSHYRLSKWLLKSENTYWKHQRESKYNFLV